MIILIFLISENITHTQKGNKEVMVTNLLTINPEQLNVNITHNVIVS